MKDGKNEKRNIKFKENMTRKEERIIKAGRSRGEENEDKH